MASVSWNHLSSAGGGLPKIGPKEQTACIVGDFGRRGVDDIVIGTRNGGGPALSLVRHQDGEWKVITLEPDDLSIEAGGAVFDVDGDGWPDIVAGGDWQSPCVWWWKNPGRDQSQRWQRHAIKAQGSHQHHDQIFGDFDGDGRAELVFWNQHARTLYWCPIPASPERTPWPFCEIWVDDSEEFPLEGLAKGDIDGDGQEELLAGGSWLKWNGAGFDRFLIDPAVRDPRVLAADFDGDGRLEVVMCPADHVGRLKLWRWTGDPRGAENWTSQDLLGEDISHGHTLLAADFDGDGCLDILAGEMRQWSSEDDNPDCRTRVLFGDGKGGFRAEEVSKGIAIHEGKAGDFLGLGRRTQVIGKPYCWQTPRLDLWIPGV